MHEHTGIDQQTARFWDDLYGGRERLFSGRPNPHLVDVAAALSTGTALDRGCGEGGDAVWLAGQGWRVTAVDVSATALDRAGSAATEAGLAPRIAFRRHDLARDFPAGSYDLVSAQFLQTPLEFPRLDVLRAAARAVAPGGRLLVVEHGAPPPVGSRRARRCPLLHPAGDPRRAGAEARPVGDRAARRAAPRRHRP